MNFNHTDDRRMLSDSLRRYFSEQYGNETRNEVAYQAPYHSPEKWAELAELGVLAALISEADGGFGGSGFDISVVFEEVGRALCPEPLLANLLCLRLLAELSAADEAEQTRTDLIAAISSGQSRAALAIYEPEATDTLSALTTKATQQTGGWQLSGKKSAVYGAPAADVLLVVARTEDTFGVFSVDATAVNQVPFAMIDGGGAAEIELDATPALCIAQGGGVAEALALALDTGRLALCAEAVGALDVLLAMTLEYLQQRKQFGTVIATFQALQHRMVDMANEIEQARSITILAASKLGNPASERSKYIAMAKNLIGRASLLVAEEATQLHGGIGMTWEYAGSHYSKRLVMLDHQLGDRFQQIHRLLANSDQAA